MTLEDETGIEFMSEFEAMPDIPFYLRCAPGEMREEARRAYVLAFITDGEGMLLKNWDEEAAKLERFLKTGAVSQLLRGGTMKVIK